MARYVTLSGGVQTWVSATTSSAGAANSGQIIGLNASGTVDTTMLPAATASAGGAVLLASGQTSATLATVASTGASTDLTDTANIARLSTSNTFAQPQLFPAGTGPAPGIAFSVAPTYGFIYGSGNVYVTVAQIAKFAFTSVGGSVGNGVLGFASTIGGAFDVGLSRSAAGILAVGTGAGQNAAGSLLTSGLQLGIRTVTAAATLTVADCTVLVDCTSAAVTITLPTGAPKNLFNIKKIDSTSNAVTITAGGTVKIDGATTMSLTTQYANATLQGNATQWYVV